MIIINQFIYTSIIFTNIKLTSDLNLSRLESKNSINVDILIANNKASRKKIRTITLTIVSKRVWRILNPYKASKYRQSMKPFNRS